MSRPGWDSVGCCEECWWERNGERHPARFKEEVRETETCTYCGKPTRSGIYVREHVDEEGRADGRG